MMEARVSVLETKVDILETRVDRHEDDKTVQIQLIEVFGRLRGVERMLWIATGGVIAVGGIATFFGWSILKELAK